MLQLVAQRVAMSSVSHSAARTSSRSLESSCVKGEQFVQGDCYAAPLGSPVWYSKCLCKCVLHGVMKSVTFVYFCGSVCIALCCYMWKNVMLSPMLLLGLSQSCFQNKPRTAADSVRSLHAVACTVVCSVVALVSRSSSNPFSVHLSVDTSCYRLEICSLWPENIFVIVNRSS